MLVSVTVPAQRGDLTSERASVQRTSPSGSSAASSFSRVTATKRPKGDHVGLPIVAQQPSRSIFGDHPHAGTRGDEQTTRRRQGEECRLRALDADDLADLVEHRPTGRAERRRDDCAQSNRNGSDTWPVRRPLHRRALAERSRDHTPSTLASLVLLREVDALELALHSSSPSTSRPRRSRELTVPRGRPSASAISPGVNSSRWRITTTARCSGGRRASASRTSSPGAAPGRGRRKRVRKLHLGAQLPRTRPVDRAVDDDPVQPRSERPAPIEAVECSQRGEKRLLRDVLCGRGIVGDEVGGAIRPRPVRPEEGLEIGDRSLLRAAHAGALVASGAHPVPRLRRSRSLRSTPRLRAEQFERSK